MASIDNMLEQFKDIAELKAYAEGQSKTIIELSKKNKKLEDENKKLNSLIEQERLIGVKSSIQSNISDEENIARMQLKLLKTFSDDRELTYEESKKVELYTKIVKEFDNKKNKLPNTNSEEKLEDLLRLVKND